MNKYYIYNGFNKPELVDIENVIVAHALQGDKTNIFLEEHNEWKDEADEDYNEQMNNYGVYRNPTLEDFQIANRSYGLENDTYLNEWI